MDLGPLRALALDANFSAHGLDVTVIRPAPDDQPIENARGIWLTTEALDLPGGAEFQRKTPRRVMALRRSEVPTVPRGTLIQAPEKAGDTDVQTWRVDGTERQEADHTRVIVVLDTTAGS